MWRQLASALKRWLPVLGVAALVGGFATVLLVAPPLILPIALLGAAVAFATGGVVVYRTSRGEVVRVIAVAAVVTGFLIALLGGLTFVTLDVTGGGGVETGEGSAETLPTLPPP